jgi:hypothetical protein
VPIVIAAWLRMMPRVGWGLNRWLSRTLIVVALLVAAGCGNDNKGKTDASVQQDAAPDTPGSTSCVLDVSKLDNCTL